MSERPYHNYSPSEGYTLEELRKTHEYKKANKMNADQEISKWAFTQATREMDCPKCGALAGNHCVTPKGRDTNTPHGQRCKAYRDKIGMDEWKRRHSMKFEPLKFDN